MFAADLRAAISSDVPSIFAIALKFASGSLAFSATISVALAVAAVDANDILSVVFTFVRLATKAESI